MFKILVIDDSALMRKVSRDILEAEDFGVDELVPASTAELAKWLRDSPPDLVLCDLNVPGVDGLAVARTARQTNPALPVIILTANRDAEREVLLKTLGVRKILHKPIQGETLISAVCEILAST